MKIFFHAFLIALILKNVYTSFYLSCFDGFELNFIYYYLLIIDIKNIVRKKNNEYWSNEYLEMARDLF